MFAKGYKELLNLRKKLLSKVKLMIIIGYMVYHLE